MNDLPIRDIKPPLPIPDISFYLFSGLMLFVLLALIGLGYFAYRWWRAHRHIDRRKEWLAVLDAMDLHQAKRSAYLMTRYGRLLAEDERRKEIYEALLPKLERYKYQKEVPPLDEETKRYIKLFLQMSHDAL